MILEFDESSMDISIQLLWWIKEHIGEAKYESDKFKDVVLVDESRDLLKIMKNYTKN
jgi:hypothetical protein